MTHVERTKMDDFTDGNGEIDWKALTAAEKQNGEMCKECGSSILRPVGHPASCVDCEEFTTDDGDVTHSKRVRCPSCGRQIDPSDDWYDLYEEGEHDIDCPECEHSFTVSTHVSHTFTSPPRVVKKEEDQ